MANVSLKLTLGVHLLEKQILHQSSHEETVSKRDRNV